MKLPVEFTNRMRRILGEEYGAFEKSYEEVRKYGLRVNTKKISPEEFERISPFHLTKIPWISGGYYYLEEDAPARHPYYYAGLYYLQEPSAMTPASVLEVTPGERVLDLCAAPGGKATALGGKLQGQGLLVANDISASRAKALLKNIEVFGIPNSFVTNGIPARLAEQFPSFFDKVLVDAPCSGEGMFRKDENTIKAWYPGKPEECANVQKDIIVQAADMLRPGGMLLYSTCTFAPQENEEVILHLLLRRPEMKLQEIPYREGFSQGLRQEMYLDKNSPGQGAQDGENGSLPEITRCVRLWPHKMGGEGHFLALLRKDDVQREKGQETRRTEKMGKRRSHNSGNKSTFPDKAQLRTLQGFFRDVSWKIELSRVEIRGDQVYQVSQLLPEVSGIPFLRNGLYMGELKKDRFEPSQSLAMALQKQDYAYAVDLSPNDERVFQYLKGETIEIAEDEAARRSGWQLVCVDGFPLGWGKLVNGRLKNKYHPGWRMK